MTAFFFKDIPAFRMDGFCSVRDALTNLTNTLQLAEIVNTCGHCRAEDESDFDVAIFSGTFSRALVRKEDGFFSMYIPFQIIEDPERITFNLDAFKEEVSGQFISIMRNAILTAQEVSHSHEDIICSIADSFGLDVAMAVHYYDAFAMLVSDDHGYFRFDDDLRRADGHIHPRYHFDFFMKDASAIKIGSDTTVDIECFYALFDQAKPKQYLRKA